MPLRYFFILIALVWTQIAICQNAIVFEQIALNYFTDSLFQAKSPFKNYNEIHFSGEVDSGITWVDQTLIRAYPDDVQLKDSYNSRFEDNEFWKKNKKASFPLETKSEKLLIKKDLKNSNTNKVLKIVIYQNLVVNHKNYVRFRVFVDEGTSGYDIYFVMSEKGEIESLVVQSFVF